MFSFLDPCVQVSVVNTTRQIYQYYTVSGDTKYCPILPGLFSLLSPISKYYYNNWDLLSPPPTYCVLHSVNVQNKSQNLC